MAESIYEQLIQSPAVRGFMQNHGLLGNPHVNIADQARLQDADGKRQQAVRAGAEYDKDTYKQLFKGLGKLTGIQSGPKTQAVGNFASNNLAKLAPYGEQLFPQTWNDLHGSRGSVATLAGAVQDTQPNDDPAAAAQTAGTIFKKLHNPFTGPGTSGLSTTHLGPLYKDMHARGLLGTKGGPNADNSAKQLGGMSGALRAMQDFQVAEKVSRALPELFKNAALGSVLGRSALFGLGGAALGIGASQLGRSTPRGGTSGASPPASMPSAVDPRGNWTGFKSITPDVKEKLFQTRNYVNHPGFWEEAPAKPRLLRMLEEPETAAATRAAIRSGQA